MDAQNCATCLKPQHLCVCEAVQPHDNRLFVLLLQHPQEKREALGTAQIAHLQLRHSLLRIGLSWPGLKRILGREVDHRRWGVLYLGPQRPGGKGGPRQPVTVVDKAGTALPDSDTILAGLEGLIVLDGTWSQAKTLWWRNPWLLKCRRLVLDPPTRSLYGQARREPRRDSLSTLEATALVVATLEGDAGLYDRLLAPFALLLRKIRAPRPRPSRLHPLEQLEGEEAADDSQGHGAGDEGEAFLDEGPDGLAESMEEARHEEEADRP